MEHRWNHPVALVAAVLALVGIFSAAAVALPSEAATRTLAEPAVTQVTRASRELTTQKAHAARAVRRRNEERHEARITSYFKAVAGHRKANALRMIAHQRAVEARAAAARASLARAPRAAAPAAASQGGGRCGGGLPPCCVMNRESGGNIQAQNPSSSASGKWQFLDSTWNGYGGYSSAAQAPESVQDAKARQLWAGGSGASHWGGGC